MQASLEAGIYILVDFSTQLRFLAEFDPVDTMMYEYYTAGVD